MLNNRLANFVLSTECSTAGMGSDKDSIWGDSLVAKYEKSYSRKRASGQAGRKQT